MRIAVLVAVLVAVLALAALIVSGPGRLAAQTGQTGQTLADIRQELTVLHVEVQRLRRELSTTGAPSVTLTGASVLERVAAIETELQRLTAQTEQMDHRIERIVADGTNRIGDLEFRLVELEGGDVSQLGETTTLGGDMTQLDAEISTAISTAISGGDTPGVAIQQLAIGEKADFQTAGKALADGQYRQAADLFARFDTTYPGSPLSAEANLSRGKALDGLGDTREAARAYLASFTADVTGPIAPDALFQLGAALGRLGQTDQACITLGEVGVRFPAADAAGSARQEMATLGCS